MPERAYLNASYAERDKVKALGARWDAAARRWYVPEGLALDGFAQWLTVPTDVESVNAVVPRAAATGLAEKPRGISLSQLLTGVRQTIEAAYRQGVWTTVEVIRTDVRRGHVYLELTERDARGQAVATARGMIWAAVASKIIPTFEQATGMVLGPGIKLLVQAKPSFSPLYGLSLEVASIDPSYTLGDLEAKKRDIIERLTNEGLIKKNKSLGAPWDYTRVLVIAPEQAAGLGDFKVESERLQSCGVCTFDFVHAVFQGEGAPCEIVRALQKGIESGNCYDVVVIIRGGGAVNDLAWLNSYELACAICNCQVPVFTGIGHERDNTVLDTVAHTSFDTPSKVILGIENQITHLWMGVKKEFEFIQQWSGQSCASAKLTTNRLQEQIRSQSLVHIATGRKLIQRGIEGVRHGANEAISTAKGESHRQLASVQVGAQVMLAEAKERAPALMLQVKDQTRARLGTARERAQASHDEVKRSASRSVQKAKDISSAMMREIVGQGPDKTLQRGFAIVRNAATGKPIISASELHANSDISIQMHNGARVARVAK